MSNIAAMIALLCPATSIIKCDNKQETAQAGATLILFCLHARFAALITYFGMD